MDFVPLALTVPDQFAFEGDELAVQVVGLFATLQVRVVLPPTIIEAGLSVNEIVGAFGITSITTLSYVLPDSFVQVSL